MATVNVVVPSLGDVKDVLVAEVLVKPGDVIAVDQAIILVESDKATMDIPATVAGRIVSVSVVIGDKVSEGAALASVDTGEAVQEPARVLEPDAPAAMAAAALATGDATGDGERFDLVVIGAGPGGYSAAFRAADLGLNVALVDRDETLGGVCLNVGCIPSKALLHVAGVKEEAERLVAHGVIFGEAEIDLDILRAFRHKTVSRLTDGLAQMAKQRRVHRVTGEARFAGTNTLEIRSASGIEQIGFVSCIIATGSSPVHLPMMPEDPRVVDSTGALELPFVPKRMLVIGGGIIGLEMATVYSALGARIDVVEQADRILAGVDSDLVSVWKKRNAHRFDQIMLATAVEMAVAKPEGIEVRFAGNPQAETYDLVLQAAGRRPNTRDLALESAGIVVSANGFVGVNAEMRTNVPHIFAIGDLVGQPMLAHKAVHQGHVAAEVVAGHKAAFEPLVIPSVAYTDPEVAWVGVTEETAKTDGVEVEVARFPWAASGRAIANGADYGMTKLIFARDGGRILGGAIVGPAAGDMIGEVCLAIELGADAIDIGRTIHPHPTMGETIGMAAEVALGICTDLPGASGKKL